MAKKKVEEFDPVTGELLAPEMVSFMEYLQSIGYVKKVARSRYELSNPIPVAPPLGYQEGPDMVEHIRRLVRIDAVRRGLATGIDETLEEAEDFDVGEDVEPYSPYELSELEPPVYVKSPTPLEEKVLTEPKEPAPPADVKPSKTDA